MKYEYAKLFIKDAAKLPPVAKKQLAELVRVIGTADRIDAIPHVKKMKGIPDAYRIRIGDYRVGVFLEDDMLTLVRVLHRREVYRYFP